jgi:hypothetical protein
MIHLVKTPMRQICEKRIAVFDKRRKRKKRNRE